MPTPARPVPLREPGRAGGRTLREEPAIVATTQSFNRCPPRMPRMW